MEQKTEEDMTIRLFEQNMGAYYSAHGDDALFVSEHFYGTSTVIKHFGQGLPFCTLSKLNAIGFIKDLLLVKLYRVELWSTDGARNGEWVVKKASPGNLQPMEDLLFSSAEFNASPVILAVNVVQKKNDIVVGIAFTDATTSRKIGVYEFVDNEALSNFETVLIQHGVKECIIPQESQSNAYHSSKIEDILSRCGVVVSKVPKSAFKQDNLEQDLNRLLSTDLPVVSLLEFDLKIAMASTSALIEYLGLLGDEDNFAKYNIDQHDLSRFMRLDAAALHALHLIPVNQGAKTMSLIGLLDACKTTQGSRLLAQWVKQPLLSLPDIKMRHDLVDAFCTDSILRQTLQEDQLRLFPDLQRLGKRFQRNTANLQDVIRIYQVVVNIPTVIQTLMDYSGQYSTILEETFTQKLTDTYTELVKFRELVESTVDLTAADNHEYVIKPNFSEELLEISGQMVTGRKQMQIEAERVARFLNVDFEKKLKFEKSPQYGFHMRLSRADASKIRGNTSYIELSTIKSGVLFSTESMLRLSNEYRDMEASYHELQSNVAKEIITISGTYFPVLDELNQVIAHLDVIVSFAHVAVNAPTPYVRPTMTALGVGDTILKKSRHPCVEVQDDISFIENDVELVRGMDKILTLYVVLLAVLT